MITRQIPYRFITQFRALFLALTLLFSKALSAQSKSNHTHKPVKTPTIIVQPNVSDLHIHQSEKDTTKTAAHKKPKKKPAVSTLNRLNRPGSTVIHRQDAFEKKP
jgi:hypothetical protein